MSKSILYLTYDGLSDPLGQSQILPYMAGLSDMGYKIIIVSFEKTLNLRSRLIDLQKFTESKKIFWIHKTYTKYPIVLSTVWDLFILNNTLRKVFRQNKVDVIHCRSYLTSLVGLRAKEKFGTPFIFDMRGFWVDERIEGNIWDAKNPLYKLLFTYFKRKEILLLKNADHVITLTEVARDIILDWPINKLPKQISVIPTCLDTNHFTRQEIEEVTITRSDLKINDGSFVLLYIGSLGTWYLLTEMMTFFSILLTKKSDAIFLLVTRENKKVIYDECLKHNISIERIRIISAERSQVPNLITLSNWSIFFIKPVFSKKGSMPTKFAELIGMGIPILCNKGIGDLDKLFIDYSLGICISDFSEENLENAADRMLRNINFKPIYEVIDDKFSLAQGTSDLSNIYTSLCEN